MTNRLNHLRPAIARIGAGRDNVRPDDRAPGRGPAVIVTVSRRVR